MPGFPVLRPGSAPSSPPGVQSSSHRRGGFWWLGVALLWSAATVGDRIWLALDRRLPSWDQADYLNSALDHGRALGLLRGGGWPGLDGLLDLSPKIPPLASLVNGTVMALAGETPDQASWALALWFALLVAATAAWAHDLVGRRFALLTTALLVLVPALATARVDYTLDLPLTACTTLALWRLGLWLQPAQRGGNRWSQALLAGLAIAAALLVKQSALLMLAGPCLWAIGHSLGRPRRLPQLLAGLAVVLVMLLPWLHHNWISTLGGTNRAVLESAAQEGDPSVLSLASLLWYPRLWPQQLGWALLLPVFGMTAVGFVRSRRSWLGPARIWLRELRGLRGLRGQRGQRALGGQRALPIPQLPKLPVGWGWVVGCALSGWLVTSLSPNKDPRYIVPLLPLLTLLVARGWWQIGQELWRQSSAGASRPRWLAAAALGVGLAAAAGETVQRQELALQRQAPSPAPEVMAELRRRLGGRAITLLVVPGSPDLNEQTLTTYGRLNGGQIVARRLGRDRREHPLVLKRSDWILLASGDQGTTRPISRELSHRVRQDGRFQQVKRWPWNQGREVELWQRLPEPGRASQPFDPEFIALARGMESGPRGVRRLFERIGAEHQADGHFLYQERVQRWASARLAADPDDRDALWSLALLETLRNRPAAARAWYAQLRQLEPLSPWPTAYETLVLLADWRPGSAAALLAEAPEAISREPVLRALNSLSRGLSGHPLALESLRISLPEAIRSVRLQLDTDASPQHGASPPSPQAKVRSMVRSALQSTVRSAADSPAAGSAENSTAD